MKYALLEGNQVINIVMCDPNGSWQPSKGQWVLKTENATIGDIYDSHKQVFYRTTKQKKDKELIEHIETIRL